MDRLTIPAMVWTPKPAGKTLKPVLEVFGDNQDGSGLAYRCLGQQLPPWPTPAVIGNFCQLMVPNRTRTACLYSYGRMNAEWLFFRQRSI